VAEGRVKALLFFGTRPEAIKLAPVIRSLEESGRFDPIVCVSGQHRSLLDQALALFSIRPQYDLSVMIPDQSLFHLTQIGLARLEPILKKERPELVIVQGDAQSAFVGALGGYYERIPVAHVEAGLRTGDKYSPFPEEMNRRLIDHISDFLFAPTERAKENLLREGIPADSIFVPGNTEIDSLFYVRDHIPPRIKFDFPRLILVTAHRRESFEGGIARICQGLRLIASQEPEVRIVFPVHPNPHVQKLVLNELDGVERIRLIDPLDYASFAHLMAAATLILTDSGGIQEAGAALHIPVLVLREKTERVEGLETGAARLIGTDPERIASESARLLHDPSAYSRMREAMNPYGDGRAGSRIVKFLERSFS